MGKWLRRAGAVVVLLGLAGFGVVEARWKRTFDVPYPALRATSDAAVVERGRYLVYGPAACAYCHVPREDWARLAAGEELPLSGQHLFRLPFGELRSANLTTDGQTGIGLRTDGELARILRHNVRADGRAALPLMEYSGLSDDDLIAVISFLRSQPAVRSEVPEHRLTLLGKALMAFAIEPQGLAATPPVHTPGAAASVERGDYLANKVAACASCHTDRGGDGALIGPPFAGGQRMDVAADGTKVFVTPNLTPDPATSVIGVWTEDAFIVRFRQGEAIAGTPMPWGAFARMTDDELRSVFRYLRSLPPMRHATGPRIQPK